MRMIRDLLYQIYTFFNQLVLEVQLFFYFQTHTMQDLENRLVELGCTKTVSRTARIYTTSNGVGKIVVTDHDIWINPK